MIISVYYLFLLFFFFITSCVGLETQNMKILSYQYSEEVNGWLKLHRQPATWNDAHTHCLQEGARLASPINSRFLKAMINIIVSHNLYCGVFTGINDKMVPGHFSSIEGIPLRRISIPFEEKQQCPEEYGGWVVLRPSESIDFVGLDDTYPYICYKKNHSDTENGNLGYVKDDSTGSYYKFHQNAKNWHDAALTCAKEAAHLVIINSDEEATVLKKLFKNYPAHILKTVTNDTDVLSVGMYKWTETKAWLTLHGQELNDAGYSKWGTFKGTIQPEGTGICGGMFRSGLLDDIHCSTKKYVFICERTPHVDAENF